MYARVVYSIVAVLLVLMCLGCSTNNVGTLDGPNHSASRFTLNVDNGTFFNGSSVDGIYTTETDYDNHVVVTVHAAGAQDLKALYFTLEYDATVYRPMRVTPTDAMGHQDDMLRLELRTIPGKVVYGQVLTNPDWREGFSGNATMATVSFRKEACPIVRNVSANTAPNLAGSATILALDTDTDTLSWPYYSLGDYNQDGLVTASDMTPVGQRYENQSAAFPLPFPVESADSAADGNANGMIEVGDITPIGQNYENNALGGYNIYVGDIGDIPAAFADGNGAGTLVTNVLFADMDGDRATDRVSHEHILAAPVNAAYYWVRPVHSGTDQEGFPSNGVQYSNVPKAVLTMVTAPVSGTGTGADRFVVNVTTDYIFSLVDPTDGDVSNDANAVYLVSDPLAGTIASVDATLNVENAFAGDFTVTATYNAIGADKTLYFHVEDPPEEQLWIMPDSTDADWGDVPEGDGTTGSRYVLLNNTFNPTGLIEFTLAANTLEDGSGDVIPIADVTWDSLPPFTAFWDGTEVSTFTVHYDAGGGGTSLCNGAIYAEDASMVRSQNDIWVQSKILP